MDNETRTIIGKDIIESLTLGMYEDSRFVYREYIQNAADQIDRAVEAGILSNHDNGYIDITIDKNQRKISIKDNATGIEARRVSEVLKNIAQSSKQRGIDKGFRGIGRLGGLAYCTKLVFETSYKGEEVKTILVWDAEKLRKIINNRKSKETATEVIDAITTVKQQSEISDLHYFCVTLEGVTNDILLDKAQITDYLSMVAPAPFHNRFLLLPKILKDLESRNLKLDEYDIAINDDKIFKGYKKNIYEGADKANLRVIDELVDIETFYFTTSDGEPLCWGWYGISSFNKQIPNHVNLARGIRLRKDNIQIGSESCLVKLHKESRGNFYFIGEVHALHPDIIPNARRDYFLENEVCSLLEYRLQELFHKTLYPLYYFASSVRGHLKKLDNYEKRKQAFEEKQGVGFTNEEDAKKHKKELESLQKQAIDSNKQLKKIVSSIEEDGSSPKQKVLKSLLDVDDDGTTTIPELDISDYLLSDNARTKFLTDDLSSLSRSERKLLSKIFAIIDKVLPKEVAENLKLKLKEEFK